MGQPSSCDSSSKEYSNVKQMFECSFEYIILKCFLSGFLIWQKYFEVICNFIQNAAVSFQVNQSCYFEIKLLLPVSWIVLTVCTLENVILIEYPNPTSLHAQDTLSEQTYLVSVKKFYFTH